MLPLEEDTDSWVKYFSDFDLVSLVSSVGTPGSASISSAVSFEITACAFPRAIMENI